MTNKKNTNEETRKKLRNEDPISGAPGAHSTGSGIGAAVGGAVAGAGAGLAAGPIGTIAGAVVGGVAGGLAGKAIAEKIDPTVETEYWRSTYSQRPYYDEQYTYEDYKPAYQAGWESFESTSPAAWSERERTARERWENEGGQPAMTWDEARLAAQDAYDRAHGQFNNKKPR